MKKDRNGVVNVWRWSFIKAQRLNHRGVDNQSKIILIILVFESIRSFCGSVINQPVYLHLPKVVGLKGPNSDNTKFYFKKNTKTNDEGL